MPLDPVIPVLEFTVGKKAVCFQQTFISVVSDYAEVPWRRGGWGKSERKTLITSGHTLISEMLKCVCLRVTLVWRGGV